MYLKSLVLKGFKSFADRSVLNLEPGVTCIVGPNGSGKSNISDAILWVLGERSPKNLRGQSMEDVIFAGSKGRKAVNVAEVTLVLDNSDGAIPVEYTEIELTRRMYRTGGSDYLINGAPARLLDFLNILHDSGLGTGTHSIISQGNLEAILQSKPEDRRSLIEEAAGVLKHKQRKEASFRKLELMDASMARVRDIFGEVSRQMGPLERKAKRALTYKELTGEYAELRLGLAVDDLRVLQRRWDEVEGARVEDEAKTEDLKSRLAAAEAEYEELSRALEAESRNREEAMGRRARYTAVASQMDSCASLLRQMRSADDTRVAEERDLLQSLADEERKLGLEVDSLAAAEQEAADKASKAAEEKASVLSQQDAIGEKVREAGRTLDAIHRERRSADEQLAGLRKRLSVAQSEFDSDDHRLQFIKDSIKKARENLHALMKQEGAAKTTLDEAKAACEEARLTVADADRRVESLAAQGRALDTRFTELRESVAVLEA
ncbi:MAG: AAA family ATPase, partial [Eggerthellaceae bacterium]|nr:AAA family ATPase [Eggerthellaceae bacterium]